jgi:hypothetical protein
MHVTTVSLSWRVFRLFFKFEGISGKCVTDWDENGIFNSNMSDSRLLQRWLLYRVTPDGKASQKTALYHIFFWSLSSVFSRYFFRPFLFLSSLRFFTFLLSLLSLASFSSSGHTLALPLSIAVFISFPLPLRFYLLLHISSSFLAILSRFLSIPVVKWFFGLRPPSGILNNTKEHITAFFSISYVGESPKTQ